MIVKMQCCRLGLEHKLFFLDGQTQALLSKYAYWYITQLRRLAAARTTATRINKSLPRKTNGTKMNFT
jgi:hypothetical protein